MSSYRNMTEEEVDRFSAGVAKGTVQLEEMSPGEVSAIVESVQSPYGKVNICRDMGQIMDDMGPASFLTQEDWTSDGYKKNRPRILVMSTRPAWMPGKFTNKSLSAKPFEHTVVYVMKLQDDWFHVFAELQDVSGPIIYPRYMEWYVRRSMACRCDQLRGVLDAAGSVEFAALMSLGRQ